MQMTMRRGALARLAAVIVGIIVLAGAAVVTYRAISDDHDEPVQAQDTEGQEGHQPPSQGGQNASAPVRVVGGATTIIKGRTDAPDLTPTIATLGVNAERDGGSLECVAFVSSAAPGKPGSGVFDKQIMYLTGTINSIEVSGTDPDFIAFVRGTATVTGLGAGKGVPLEGTIHSGGPGVSFELKFSGLTLNGIVTDGSIHVTHEYVPHEE